MFEPINSERLTIRAFVESDVRELAVRRNDPDVARYQNWEIPYPVEKVEEIVTSLVEMEGPTDDEWWMAVVCDSETGATLGDLAVHLSWGGRTAEIGYTFSPEHWGRGYASEALGRLVDYLFDEVGVTRIFGMLHPDNPASAMVMERNGFLFEGHTRSSFWLGGEVSDDWIYGLLRTDRDAWRNRPTAPPDDVALIAITVENERDVSKLKTHKTQERFVAPMAWSFTDALFPEVIDGAPVVPWMRAVTADGDIVGFAMVALTTEAHPEPYLWRLLVDRRHQRRGIGRRVLDLVAAECRLWGDSTLLTSWGEGTGSPKPFYLGYGFEPTGRTVDGETEARLTLA